MKRPRSAYLKFYGSKGALAPIAAPKGRARTLPWGNLPEELAGIPKTEILSYWKEWRNPKHLPGGYVPPELRTRKGFWQYLRSQKKIDEEEHIEKPSRGAV